jgi:hypothetical protein
MLAARDRVQSILSGEDGAYPRPEDNLNFVYLSQEEEQALKLAGPRDIENDIQEHVSRRVSMQTVL